MTSPADMRDSFREFQDQKLAILYRPAIGMKTTNFSELETRENSSRERTYVDIGHRSRWHGIVHCKFLRPDDGLGKPAKRAYPADRNDWIDQNQRSGKSDLSTTTRPRGELGFDVRAKLYPRRDEI